MSVKVLSAVLEHSPSKANKLLALIVLANNANDDGWAFPGQDDIADKLRVVKRTAQRTLDALEADGEIVIYNRVNPRKPDEFYSNCYHLTKYGKAGASPPLELRGELRPRKHGGSDADDTPPSDVDDTGGSDTGVMRGSDTGGGEVATPAPSDPLLNRKEKETDSDIPLLGESALPDPRDPTAAERLAWDMAYQQLELQLDSGSFETYVRGAALLRVEGRVYVIGVRSEAAQKTLQSGFYRKVRRVLVDVIGLHTAANDASGKDAELVFEVSQTTMSKGA